MMMDAGAVQAGWGRRLQQGIRSLLSPLLPLDVSPARVLLSDEQFALFHQLRRDEQLHALCVLATVRAQPGELPLVLARAALLHDIGKLRCPLSVWSKTWAVLAGSRLAFGQRPQRVLVEHPAWGAALAAAASADERTCWLIAEHQTPAARWAGHPDFELLERLQAADRQH